MRGLSGRRMSLVAVLVSLVLCCSAFAAEGKQDAKPWTSDISVDLAGTYNGMYVWRGIRVVDGRVLQPSASVGYDGLSVGAWGNMDLSDINGQDNDFTEIDLTVDYSWSWESLALSVGSVYYTFPHGPANASTLELYGSVGLDAPLSPSVTLYQDVDEAGGSYATLSVGHTFEDLFRPVEGVPVSLQLGGSMAYGSSGFNEFYYGTNSAGPADAVLTASLPVQVSENLSLSPTLNYSTLLDGAIRDSLQKPESFWAGVTLSYSF